MPRRARSLGLSQVMSAPSNVITPLLTGCCPASASRRLVLPTPLRPSTQVTLPGSAESDTLRNACAALAHRRQPDDLEDAVDAARLFFALAPEQGLARAPVALQREADIVLDRVHVEDGRLLELATNAEERDLGLVEAREIVGTVEVDLAGIGSGLAGDHIHHGGLAGAVGADDGTHLSRLDGEGEVVERAEAVERHSHAVEVEKRRGAASIHRSLRRPGSRRARVRGRA